jgi:hypothetical protein
MVKTLILGILICIGTTLSYGLRDEEGGHAEINADQWKQATFSAKQDVSQVRSSRGFPDDKLEGIAVAPLSEDEVNELVLGPFNTLTYENKDCTGSAWGRTTLPGKALASLGVRGIDIPPEQSVDLQFALVDPGCSPSLSHGGYVYRNDEKIVGANKFCGQEEAQYTFEFEPPVDIDELPPHFSVGRMQRITLEHLLELGATRFTWIQREEGLMLHSANKLQKPPTRGGFLYELAGGEFAQKPCLKFFEMAVQPQAQRQAPAIVQKNQGSEVSSKGLHISINIQTNSSGNVVPSVTVRH